MILPIFFIQSTDNLHLFIIQKCGNIPEVFDFSIILKALDNGIEFFKSFPCPVSSDFSQRPVSDIITLRPPIAEKLHETTIKNVSLKPP